MTRQQKRIFALLILITVIVFALFAWPNSVASDNLAMVQMFQPDEASPLPYIFNMIAPAENLNQALRSFVFYEYYFYGFPYFGLSALVLLPLKWLGQTGNIPLVMVLLRQLISMLPLLTALMILTYMQDGFRTYRSVVLYIFLLCIPAVVQNNLWWHPDGLTILFVVLTLFFLKRDDLRFGKNFLFAAIAVGTATAIKLVGAYFFLAVGLTLILGFFLKKASWKKLLVMAIAFLLLMGLSFLISNPFLLSHWARTEYINIFHKQVFLLAEGYGVVYKTGLAAAWPTMQPYFGGAFFLFIALGTAIWGAWRGPQRLLHGLILAWFFPVTILIVFVTHFKFQYWMPVALPLFSSLILLLPEKWEVEKNSFKSGFRKIAAKLAPVLFLAIVLTQSFFFIKQDFQKFTTDLRRAENNSHIGFYHQAVNALAPLPTSSYSVYYDYRLYVPETEGWTTETTFELLEYNYIQESNFDVLLLLEQRIQDYLNPEATGIDPKTFALNQQFYRDAENGTIDGYTLIYRNDIGLVYVRKDIYQSHFQK